MATIVWTPWVPPVTPWTPADTLNATATPAAKIQQTVAGAGDVVPIVYGRARIGAKITAITKPQTFSINLLLRAVWCMGECDALETIWINDLAVPASVTVTNYLGAPGQGIDPTLRDAYAAHGLTYADTLPGVCYSVLNIPTGACAGFPRLTAQVRGLKVRPTVAGTRAWSQNPALIIADFIESVDYGMGRAVDWATVATAVSACDAMVGDPAEKKRILNLVLDTPQAGEVWLNQLRDYAGCWIVPEGNIYRLIPDATGSSVMSFTTANIVRDTLRVNMKSTLDSPTAIETTWTNTTTTPWRDDTATVYAPQVLAGTKSRRMARYSRQGIQRYSEAYRYGVERLNYALINDMTVQFTAFDEALKLQVGDLFDVTHPAGLSAKVFRAMSINPAGPGRWQIAGHEYDPAVYSSVVVVGPGVTNTELPDPTKPPQVDGVAAEEEIYQTDTGTWASRLRIHWTGPVKPFPFIQSYRVEIRATLLLTHALISTPNALVHSAIVPATDLEYVTKPIAENTQYDISVCIVASLTGAIGLAGVCSIVPLGKTALPKDFAQLTGYEVGGEVRLTWSTEAWDGGIIDLDWTTTELRYGAVGGSWDAATLLDRVAAPAIRYDTKDIVPGTWVFYARPRDSVRSTFKTAVTGDRTIGQLSDGTHQASCTITVTSDANAFLAAYYSFTSPLLTNMTAYGDGWITDFADTWNSLFTSTLNTYTDVLLSYHTSGTSGLVTEKSDFGLSLTGDWFYSLGYTNIAGTATVAVELNSAGAEATKTITAATNANPIEITSTAHGYPGGDEVEIVGVVGNTAANGLRKVVFVSADKYTLTDLLGVNVAGNGTYSSGGTSARWIWSSYVAATVKTTARYGRLRISTQTTGTIKVTDLGNLKCNAVGRRESGSVTTAASGPTIVYLANKYNKVKSVTVTPTGSTSRSGSPDQIEVSAARGLGVYYTVRFNGTSDYIDVNDSASLQIAQPLTVEAWVNLTSNAASQTMVRKDTETGTRYLWSLQIVGSSGLVRAAYYNGTTFRADSLSPIALGRWVHVAMIISGTALYLLVDGVRQNSATISGTQNPPTGRMSIGCSPPFVGGGTRAEYFGGVIDDVRVWNVARADADIIANKDIELTGSETGLKGYWKLNSTSGTTATDSTANANTGTLSGGKWRPYDGFNAYAFTTSTGEQVPADCFWEFEGV